MKPKISVAIATYNEEENIAVCLESVKSFVDEMVVVDGSSTDTTRSLAKEAGAKVIKTTNPAMFHINKNKAIKACTGDWVLVLDADERVSPELGRELKKTARKWQKGRPVGYWLKRKNYFLGRYLKKGGQYPDPVIRFFKKNKGRHPEKSVHEQIEIDGKVGWLENELLHWATPYFSRYLGRWHRYTALDAAKLKKAKTPVSLLTAGKYIIFLPVKTFLSIYVFHRGFVDGWPGFVFALFSGLHHAGAYFKYLRLIK